MRQERRENSKYVWSSAVNAIYLDRYLFCHIPYTLQKHLWFRTVLLCNFYAPSICHFAYASLVGLYWTVNVDFMSPNNAKGRIWDRAKQDIIQCTFEFSFVLKVNRHQRDPYALPPASGLPLAGPLCTPACLGLGGGQPPSLSLTPITLTTVLRKASLTLSCLGRFKIGPLAGWLHSAWVCSHPLEMAQAKCYALASPFFSTTAMFYSEHLRRLII